jgi:hypothetical protein
MPIFCTGRQACFVHVLAATLAIDSSICNEGYLQVVQVLPKTVSSFAPAL